MDKVDILLRTGAGAVVAASLFALLFDPTAADTRRLDNIAAIQARHKPLAANSALSPRQEAAALGQAPIFVMSTGAGAFSDKPIQIFGLSVSAGRKAVLAGIDGGPPQWMKPGDTSGDVRCLDVGVNGATFETPLGTRTIGLNDAPASVAPASGPQGG